MNAHAEQHRQMREAFEAWSDSPLVNKGSAKHHRSGDGYCQHHVNDAWKGWKADLAASPEYSAPISQYQNELLARARARIAASRVQYGDKIAYPADIQLVIDLVGQIESLTIALEMNALAARGT